MSKVNIKPLHVGISVANLDETLAWYEEYLGFEFIKRFYLPPAKSEIAFVRNGEFEIEFFQHDESIALPEDRLSPNTDAKTQGTKHICFRHDDVETLLNELKAKGVEVIIGPQIIDGTVMGFIRDNNGTIIEFIQPE